MAKGEGVVKSDENSVDLDQYAKDALDEVFSKEQQSYEEFLQGFMFLKKGKEFLFVLMTTVHILNWCIVFIGTDVFFNLHGIKN